MSPIENFLNSITDALTVLGAGFAIYFLWRAMNAGSIEAPSIALIGIGCAIVPFTLASTVHNWSMRSKADRECQDRTGTL